MHIFYYSWRGKKRYTKWNVGVLFVSVYSSSCVFIPLFISNWIILLNRRDRNDHGQRLMRKDEKERFIFTFFENAGETRKKRAKRKRKEDWRRGGAIPCNCLSYVAHFSRNVYTMWYGRCIYNEKGSYWIFFFRISDGKRRTRLFNVFEKRQKSEKFEINSTFLSSFEINVCKYGLSLSKTNERKSIEIKRVF